ncbi:MAG: flagellar biosynthesis protein FlhF [Lachnospiraceae bacterium]|nr:flagellar biosynthesis protein FlhF [Lachnospiraceae bacterium]
MIIKKYTAATETEAIMLAKEDLGKDAIVMNMKTTKPKGLQKLFKKPVVEITAAVDENPAPTKKIKRGDQKAEPKKEPLSKEEQEKNAAIEEKLDNLAMLLEQKMADEVKKEKGITESLKNNTFDTTIVKTADIGKAPEEKQSKKDRLSELIYEQLRNNEVNENYAKSIVAELSDMNGKTNMDDLLSRVYQKIVLKLGEIHTIKALKDKPMVLFFIGPTGVGKTTTIAKLAAKYKLDKGMKVAFVTADTFRIAAEEQLKTYAGIMSIPIEIIYEPDDLKEKIKKFEDYDLIFVDTVGHSHKNEEQLDSIRKLLDMVPVIQKDVYLVLSATTKYNDLIKITKTYESMAKYSMIFTKLDETSAHGNILNLKLATGYPLSYVAWGQNVPDDIGEVDAQKIAKRLLGGNA